MVPQIPQEIWWLVCQDLKRQFDFKSLFNCALVCKSWATHALPLLYSIHDYAAPEDLGISGYEKAKWAGMWRSIILSSIGVAAYPYSLWIKSLGLSDFQQLLLDIAPDSNLRPHFFKGRMKEFEIVSRTTRTRTGKPVLASQEIIEKVGDTIIKYAKEENKIMQLTSLEASFVPTLLLSIWTSQLPTLTTLTIRDGSVLTEEVAHSIRENCPSFKDLTCYNIRGSTVDENMSAFFFGLRKNSLENFCVLSSNEIGYNALEGLMQHSSSLRSLTLSSLQNTTLPFLHLLSRCQYIESLEIESSTNFPPSTWTTDGKDTLIEVSSWLKECKHLKRLCFDKVCGASKLLSEALISPNLRLKDLEVRLVDDEEAFYTALGSQSDLQSFQFRSTAEVTDVNNVRHDKFIDSICSCKELTDLNIMHSGIDQVQLTPDDLLQIKESLPNLHSISFDGEWLSDAIFEPLSQMSCLITIFINGISVFTYGGIKSFIEAVKATGSRDDFRLYVMAQHSDAEITDAQQNALVKLANQIPGGSFEFEYWRDPEDSMSDLSD